MQARAVARMVQGLLAPDRTPGRADARRGWHWLALAPFLALALWHWGERPGATSGDYAQYILHAKALLAGRPYAETGYLFTRYNPLIGPVAYPPGLPLTLLPLLAAGADLTWAGPALMIVSGLAFLALSQAGLARLGGWGMASAATLLVGIALEASRASVVVLSDLGFCAFVWGVILVLDARGAWSPWRVLAAAALTAAALGYRVAAIAILPAVVTWMLARQGRPTPRSLLLVVVALGGAAGVLALFPSVLPANWYAIDAGLLARRVVRNTAQLRFAVSDVLLRPWPWGILEGAYQVAGLAAVLVGALGLLREHGRSFLCHFAVVYVAMLIVSPVFEVRYFWPVFPLIGLALLRGVTRLGAVAVHLGLLRPGRARAVGAAALLLVPAGAWVRAAADPPPPSLDDVPEAQTLLDTLAAWHRGAPVRAVFANPRVLTLRTGIPAMGYFHRAEDATLAELRAKRITHVVLSDVGAPAPCVLWAVRRAVAAYPSQFRLRWTLGGTRVYEVANRGEARVDRAAMEAVPPPAGEEAEEAAECRVPRSGTAPLPE